MEQTRKIGIDPNGRYTEDEVVASLSKKKDYRINKTTKVVEVLNANKIKLSNTKTNMAHDLGNGSNGKLDFLKNFCNYTVYTVAKFTDLTKKEYKN